MKKWLPLIVVAVSMAGYVYFVRSKPKPVTQEQSKRVWTVQAQKIQLQSHRPQLQLYGTVESPSLVELTAAVEADVKGVQVKAGDRVSKGQLLIELDGSEAHQRLRQRQADLAASKAKLGAEYKRYQNDKKALSYEKRLVALAEKAWQRAESLQEKSLASKNQLDQAQKALVQQQLALAQREYAVADHPSRLAQIKSQIEKAAAQLELARLDLRRTRVEAAYDGKVTAVYVAAGKRVRMGEKLLGLFNPQTLEVRAQIPAAQLATVNQALEQGLELNASGQLDDSPLQLRLRRLSSRITAGRGGVDGYFQVSQEQRELPIGRVLNIYLTLPELARTAVIPREALYGIDRVYKIEDNTLVAIDVQLLGEITDRGLIIRSDGLAEGDTLLVTKFANAMDGLSVKVNKVLP